MKSRKSENKIVGNAVATKGQFGIDPKHLAHIFDILRNSLYSDPIMAVLREYSTNAHDAHVEAEVTKPFEVWLPTNSDPTFTIRDYGHGLDPEDIMQVYCMYGASTKRHSNDFNGTLGLGSKSAFSYSESFSITSYLNGQVYFYSALIDETQIGEVKLIRQEATTKENGTEIKIPVKLGDLRTFQEKAKRIFTFFDPGFYKLHNYDERTYGKIERIKALMDGDGWRIVTLDKYGYNNYNKSSFAVMGCVAYPIDATHVKGEIAKSLVQSGIEFDFKIGDMEFSASREALQYTDATKQSLNRLLEKVVDELKGKYEEKLKAAKNVWEAFLTITEIMDFATVNATLRNQLLANLSWNGIKIPYDKGGFPVFDGVHVARVSSKGYGKLSSPMDYRITPSKTTTVVLNDDDTLVPTAINKLRDFVEELDANGRYKYSSGVYLLSFIGIKETDGTWKPGHTPDEVKKKWYDDYHWADVPMTMLSAIPTPKKRPRIVYSSSATASKSKVFKLEPNGANIGTYGASFWLETEIDLQTTKGLWLEINRWQPQGPKIRDVRELHQMVNLLTATGVKVPPIYGIKSVEAKKGKMGKGMKEAIPFIIDAVTAAVNEKGITQIKTDKQVFTQAQREMFTMKDIAEKLKDTSFYRQCWGKYLALEQRINTSFSQEIISLHGFATKCGLLTTEEKAYTCPLNVAKTIEELKVRYPILGWIGIGTNGIRAHEKDYSPNIVKYIEMCDYFATELEETESEPSEKQVA